MCVFKREQRGSSKATSFLHHFFQFFLLQLEKCQGQHPNLHHHCRNQGLRTVSSLKLYDYLFTLNRV